MWKNVFLWLWKIKRGTSSLHREMERSSKKFAWGEAKVSITTLDDSIDGLEVKNVRLKENIKELETALMPLPIFASPLTMINTTTSGTKFKGSSILLIVV
jgi:hypothetical protein